MKFKTNTEIAITHLTSRIKQTVVAALGVTFGMSMYIFINGLISGTNDYFEKTTLSAIPHVRIFNDAALSERSILDKYAASSSMMNVVHNRKASFERVNIHNPWAVIDEIKKDSRVQAYTAQVNASVIYSNGSFEVNGNIFGVNILEEDKMFDIKSDMKKGKIENLNSSNNGIIIGSGIASKLGVNINDNITVSSSKGTSKLMKIVGIFETTVKATDQSKSYASIRDVQQLLKENSSYITDIKVNLKDKDNAKKFAEDYAYITGYQAEDWKSANQTVGAGMIIRNYVAQAMVFTILIVAGFGIYNILNMTIYEKMKDIAILKATGFSSNDITNIFLSEAVIIGIGGGIAGITLGYIVTYLVSLIPVGLANLKTLPINFRLYDYVSSFVFGLLTTVVAGYLPAKKAARVDPVKIIRG